MNTEYGYCRCGCGQKTRLASSTRTINGVRTVKGEPLRYIHGHNGKGSLVSRFWSKVDKSAGPDGCWLWTGFLDRKGYGDFHTTGKNKRAYAHRVAYELTHGPIEDGKEVCHSCDNPRCVNPSHLWLGTHTDNMRDAIAKDRFVRGERNGLSVLTEEQVIEIRERYATKNISQAKLAAEYGISQPNVHKIIHRRSWEHI